jgi:hypothetical protein
LIHSRRLRTALLTRIIFLVICQPTVSSSFNKIAKSKKERVNYLDCALDLDAITTLILADLSNNLDLAFAKHTFA